MHQAEQNTIHLPYALPSQPFLYTSSFLFICLSLFIICILPLWPSLLYPLLFHSFIMHCSSSYIFPSQLFLYHSSFFIYLFIIIYHLYASTLTIVTFSPLFPFVYQCLSLCMLPSQPLFSSSLSFFICLSLFILYILPLWPFLLDPLLFHSFIIVHLHIYVCLNHFYISSLSLCISLSLFIIYILPL